MPVVLADVDVSGMEETLSLLAPGSTSIAATVRRFSTSDVDELADIAYRTFGECAVLFNNAGVGAAGPAWMATLDDWKWVIGVNLMGVVHGIRAFVPRMIEQGRECHIVNTASAAGLVAPAGSSVYCASKFAVVGFTECLFHELRAEHPQIGVSLLCPAYVDTGISHSDRTWPQSLRDANPQAEKISHCAGQSSRAGSPRPT